MWSAWSRCFLRSSCLVFLEHPGPVARCLSSTSEESWPLLLQMCFCSSLLSWHSNEADAAEALPQWRCSLGEGFLPIPFSIDMSAWRLLWTQIPSSALPGTPDWGVLWSSLLCSPPWQCRSWVGVLWPSEWSSVCWWPESLGCSPQNCLLAFFPLQVRQEARRCRGAIPFPRQGEEGLVTSLPKESVSEKALGTLPKDRSCPPCQNAWALLRSSLWWLLVGLRLWASLSSARSSG